MSTFVCTRCNTVIRDPYLKYQERVEYVRIDGQHRAWVHVVRDLCKPCVVEMKANAKGLGEYEQGELQW